METASVLGVPTGTFIGDFSGWRTAFAAVGILGLVSLAYTFVRPILQSDGGGDDMTGVLLLTFGVAGVCGNFIAGALIAKRLRQTVVGTCSGSAPVIALLPLLAVALPAAPRPPPLRCARERSRWRRGRRGCCPGSR